MEKIDWLKFYSQFEKCMLRYHENCDECKLLEGKFTYLIPNDKVRKIFQKYMYSFLHWHEQLYNYKYTIILIQHLKTLLRQFEVNDEVEKTLGKFFVQHCL